MTGTIIYPQWAVCEVCECKDGMIVYDDFSDEGEMSFFRTEQEARGHAKKACREDALVAVMKVISLYRRRPPEFETIDNPD